MKARLLQPKQYLNEFRALYQFSITPVYTTPQALSRAQKIEGTWKMLVVKFILAAIVGVLVGLLYDPDNKTTASMAQRFSPPVLFLVSVLILPLLEEMAFRLSMKFRPLYLSLTLGTIAYYIASKVFYQAKLSDIYNSFEERAFIMLAIIIITWPLFSFTPVKTRLAHFWQQQFRWVFYFLCFTFAWIHILNYELNLTHLLLMPLITLPKLVSAMCYGFARINYGFIYSLTIHICNNGIGFVVSSFLTGGD